MTYTPHPLPPIHELISLLHQSWHVLQTVYESVTNTIGPLEHIVFIRDLARGARDLVHARQTTPAPAAIAAVVASVAAGVPVQSGQMANMWAAADHAVLARYRSA
jgi:hypothetical protein